MPKPTHLCQLEIDPRDPSAIIQAQADKIAELEEWKASAMAVMGSIDIQAVGKELGVKLGEPIGPAILPGIRALKLDLASWQDAAQHGE